MVKTFLIIILLCISSASFAVTYDASTLHNSVKRSSSVKDLFLDRWTHIEDNRYTFDLFGTLNWVNNFQIFVINRNPNEHVKEKIPVDMRLVRTYGGFAYLHPITYSKKDAENKTANFMLAFSTYGYHYGLTKKATIKRGEAGNSSVTDYKFTQFFDDIFAASFFWKTYIHIHSGVLINNAVEPRDDGTLKYFGSSSMERNWFFASNLFLFMNFNFLLKDNRFETFDISVSPTKVYTFFGGELPKYTPELTLGIRRFAMYNDSPYDAVWVKTDKTDLDTRDSANLTLYTIMLQGNLIAQSFFNYYMAFQNSSESLIEKRTEEKLNLKPLKEVRMAVGYDFLHMPFWDLTIETGYSQYWDEAMPLHSASDNYKANGFFCSVGFGYTDPDFVSAGLKFTYSNNSSNELRKLIETTNKAIVQVDFYLSFKFYSW